MLLKFHSQSGLPGVERDLRNLNKLEDEGSEKVRRYQYLHSNKKNQMIFDLLVMFYYMLPNSIHKH